MGLRIEDPTAALEPVRSDVPTAKPHQPTDAAGPPKQSQRATRAERSRPAAGGSVDSALGSHPQPIGTRVPTELWGLAVQRAEDLGVSVRVLLTDALARALEQPGDVHHEHVRETRRREQLARINALDNQY